MRFNIAWHATYWLKTSPGMEAREPYVAQIAQRSRELDLPIACYLTGADFVNRDFEAEVTEE